jgi:hypothetical protein
MSGHHPWSEIRSKLSPERDAEIQRRIERSLARLNHPVWRLWYRVEGWFVSLLPQRWR